MTTVIGDGEESGWISMTDLTEKQRKLVEDIHRESIADKFKPRHPDAVKEVEPWYPPKWQPSPAEKQYKSVTEQYAESMLVHEIVGCGCVSAGKISVTCPRHSFPANEPGNTIPWAPPVAAQESYPGLTPQETTRLLDKGIDLQKKLEPRVKAMQGLASDKPPLTTTTTTPFTDLGGAGGGGSTASTMLNFVQSHIILAIVEKSSSPLTIPGLINHHNLSNITEQAIRNCVQKLLDSGELSLDKNMCLVMAKKPSTTATSPKTIDSSHKVPVNLCPASAIIAIAIVIAQGHKKPGRTIYNWRSQPISYSEYLGAAMRHILKSNDGSDDDPELSQLAGVPIRHDWAAMSCLAILEDARQAGTLVDDRPVKGGAETFMESLMVKK